MGKVNKDKDKDKMLGTWVGEGGCAREQLLVGGDRQSKAYSHPPYPATLHQWPPVHCPLPTAQCPVALPYGPLIFPP